MSINAVYEEMLVQSVTLLTDSAGKGRERKGWDTTRGGADILNHILTQSGWTKKRF